MSETVSIYSGDSAPFDLIGHLLEDGTVATLDSNYACNIKVVGGAIDRAVTEKTTDNKHFKPALLPAETAALAVGNHIAAVQISNPLIGLSLEVHYILAVSGGIIGTGAAPVAETELDRLLAHRAKLVEALDAAIGGSVVRVRNGRYGTEMGYQAMTYAQIKQAITDIDNDIAATINVANGGSRRGHVGIGAIGC